MLEKKLHIVYVCREFGPVTGGGIGTYIYNVCKSMVHRGHQVTLLTDCFNKDNMDALPQGVELFSTIESQAGRRGNFFSVNHEYSYRVLDTLSLLAQNKPLDIVEFAEFGVEGFAAIRAKRLFNEFAETKLIVKLHTPTSLLRTINENKFLLPETHGLSMMEDYCVLHADMVTSPSLSLADYFTKRVKRTDIVQCPYPMELPEQTNKRSFTTQQIHRVRFIGSLQVRKGLDTFIKGAILILKQEPQFTFEIWGADRNTLLFEKSYTDILKRLIPAEYKEKIVFCGAIPYSEIPDLFSDSCYCVYPSRWENWANVCLEAMSYGCVVLASKEGGMAEMIEHANSGFVIDPLDPHDYATHILSSHGDPQRLQAISTAAQKRSGDICDPHNTTLKIEANYLRPFHQKKWQSLPDNPPKVSIIIPYYNQSEYIEETVASAKSVNYPNVEIIVVNDGSTSEQANQIFDSLEGVIKVKKENGGLSSARNAGIAEASGEFVIPLDSDDLIHPDYLPLGVTALLNNDELGYVSCHAENFGALSGSYIPVGFVPELMLFINTHGKCTNLYRRDVFKQCGGYDEIMTSYEDWDFLITLHEHSINDDVLPLELFQYRRHFDSMVYSVANHQRTDLIQYMMSKHPNLLTERGSDIALTLARLWKDTEISHETALCQLANQTLQPDYPNQANLASQVMFQVYSRNHGLFSENNSVFVYFPEERWNTLYINLPFTGQDGAFRIDPSNQAGLIIINKISLVRKKNNRPLWSADGQTLFKKCLVPNNDQISVKDSNLVIEAKDNDPQILLPDMSQINEPLELLITLYFSSNIKEYKDTAQYIPPPGPAKQLLTTLKQQIIK
ncbi:MAG: glycosyltransferase [Desulfobulbaceae bacterium]|nr:glycosyltransferase [Desulfobulbaceae bacterium]